MASPNDRMEQFDLGALDTTQVSNYCLELDAWDQNKGRELLDDGEYAEQLRALDLSAEALADFYGCVFLPEPTLVDNGPKVRSGFLRQSFDSPEFWALHEQTVFDPLAAEIATLSLARSFRKLYPEKNDGEDGKLPEPGDIREELRVLRAVRDGVKEGASEVQAYRDIQGAFGLGRGGEGHAVVDASRTATLFRRVRNNAALRRIAEMAGRLRRFAQSKQRQKTRHGYDDMVGVTLGNDLGALLGEELTLLDSEFEPDLLRRYAEAELMQYEYQGVESKGLGPIFFVVDQSGSMSGLKDEAAKALALAMAWIARKQNRWCCLVAFSGGRPAQPLPLKPSGWDESALANWLTTFIGGGSELDVPLRELPQWFKDLGCPEGKTDIVFVTDGIVSVDERTRSDFLRFKKERQARAVSLIINAAAGPMREISDEVHVVRDLSLKEGAIQQLMGI